LLAALAIRKFALVVRCQTDGVNAEADLVEIAFPSEEKAEQVRQNLPDMQKEYLIELSDAVIAVKQPNGRVKLNQLFNPTASGAVSGTFSAR